MRSTPPPLSLMLALPHPDLPWLDPSQPAGARALACRERLARESGRLVGVLFLVALFSTFIVALMRFVAL